MNHSSNHLKPLIFRSGAAATRVGGEDAQLVLDCPMPWLAGPASQQLAKGAEIISNGDGWLLRGPDMLAGVLVSAGGGSLEEESLELNRRMFAITHGLNRYRIWNFVPNINEIVDGVENYVAFNSGRYHAFAEKFGGIFLKDLSAASAVGTKGGSLTLAFLAGSGTPEHFENPLQTPSSKYPQCYGKNSPLFARGSRVSCGDGRACWHLSGTASIRGSETIGCDFTQQLDVTLENIGVILKIMEVPAARRSAWKVFLRDRRDLDVCRQRLAAAYPGEIGQMMFLEADICRRDLLLEIEAVFHEVQDSN